MKRIALALFLLSALILAMVMVVNSLTTGMEKNANEFFLTVSEGQLDTAMNYLSNGFRNTLDPEEFRAYLQSSGMDTFETSSWDSRSYARSQGEIEGVIYLQDGSVQPVRLLFVLEEDEWRIHSIEAHLPGITPTINIKRLPPLKFLEHMASKTVGLFGKNVSTGDFDPFYRTISALWQSRTSPDQLLEAFKPFVDNHVDLSEFAQVPPVFNEPPLIDSGGVLRLRGYFPHEAGTLSFDLSFTYEYPEWKLLGLNVSL
ncbi:MAG: hypothetical protein KKB70_03880 [Proteobacteria bacterium]|nr:hypothetical protein [Pseudomonadota bacterium]